jgi:predicted HNH restriction endonuclease
MIPKNLTHNDFLEAAKYIDKNDIPGKRKSRTHYLVLNNKKYPPKYIITLAYELKEEEELPYNSFHTDKAKEYFKDRGYEIRVEESDGAKIVDEDEEKYYSEGKEKFKTHRSYERDGRVPIKAKEKALKETGELRCEICKTSFSETYGKLGSGYIEAHHKVPVSQLGNNGKTEIEDIALLCSNCHKMIHKTDPIKSVEELREIVNRQ